MLFQLDAGVAGSNPAFGGVASGPEPRLPIFDPDLGAYVVELSLTNPG